MSNSVLELRLNSPELVDYDRNVKFNENLLNPTDIEYDESEGIITFQRVGQYSVKWWVATETTLKGTITFELQSPEASIATPGCSSIKTGQVSGFAFIDVTAPKTTLSLKNMSPKSVMLSRKTTIKGYLLITPMGADSPRVYRGNLSTAGSFLQAPLGNGVNYRLEYDSPTQCRLVLTPINGQTRYDYKRFSIYNSTSPEGDYTDNVIINGTVTKDVLIYNGSREMHWVLIRVQNPATGLWSLYEVRLFISGGSSRATIWVNVIEEEIGY